MTARSEIAAVAAAMEGAAHVADPSQPAPAAALPWLAAPREQGAQQDDVPAANCLKPLLAALGWSGEARYLQEAVGSEYTLLTLADLRRVLFRLNYLTTPVQAELGDIPLSDFPFLLARDDGDIWVVLARDGDRLTVFQGGSSLVTSPDLAETAAHVRALYIVAPDSARAKTSKSFSSWTLSTIASEGKTIRWLFILSFAVNMAALAVPIYLIAVYDRAIAAKSLVSLFYLLGGVVLAVMLEMTLREMRARSLAFLGARMEGLMMTAAFERLLLLPAQLIENASVGAQIARLKLFESMRDVFSGPLAAALLDLPFVLIFVFAVFIIGGELGWLIVAFIVLLLLLIGLAVPMARSHTAKAGDVRSESQKFLMEFTDNIEVIRRCGAEQVWIDRYRELTEENLKHAAAAQRASVVEQTLSQSLVLITGSALIGVGAWLVIVGSFTSGALFAMMSLVWRVLAPIQTTFLHLNKLTHANAIVRQIDQLMRIEPEFHPEQVPTVPRSFKGPIELQGVVMRYTPRGEPAIRGVSLLLPRNAFVALTGHVGAGKSTILKIIAQLYLPQAGTVLIDGLDYRQFDAHLLRHAMGFLPQKQDVFTGTIAENIRLSYPAATDEAIVAMLKQLGGDTVLDGVDSGVDAAVDLHHPVIGTQNFIQKIMLARAFIGQPAILLLDEPGLRLDAGADDALRAMLTAMKGKATIVLTTTRPSYMYLADRLVVLKAGQVIGQDAPNRVIAALLAEKFKTPGGAGKPTGPLRDIRDILPSGAKGAEG